MLSNLPLQVVLYFNGWYDAFYVILMLGLYIWKGTALPYPGPLSGLLGLEIVLLFLLAAIEYARISLASRGNKTERSPSLILSVLLAFPSTYLFFYFFYQQVYVTRLDLIVSVTGIGFVALETLISLLVIMTLSMRHTHPCTQLPRHRNTHFIQLLRTHAHGCSLFSPIALLSRVPFAVRAPPATS